MGSQTAPFSLRPWGSIPRVATGTSAGVVSLYLAPVLRINIRGTPLGEP